jgi:hypothetical protein
MGPPRLAVLVLLAVAAMLVDCGADSGRGTTGNGTTTSGSGAAGSATATGATGATIGTSTGSAGTTTMPATGSGGNGGAGPGAGVGGTVGVAGSGGAVDAGGASKDAGVSPSDAGGADAGRGGLDSEISAIVGAVSSTRISETVGTLSGFTTRNSCSNNTSTGNTLGAARDWIRNQFQAIAGLTVSLEPFTFSVNIPLMGTCGPVTDQNVLAVKLGSHPDRVVVVGGHYDSRTVNVVDGTGRAPGANDSGSQTALLIEAARLMAPLSFDATLVFAAFAGEEQGLFGSIQLAQDYTRYVTSSARIEAMLDVDMVGGDTAANSATDLQQYRVFSPGTPREIMLPIGSTDDESPSRGLMRYIGYWGGRYVPSMTMVPVLREDRVGRGSDHESFLNLGYPGVRFMENVESPNSGMPGSHQHTADDLPMFVTPAYTARVAQIVLAVGASLARAPTPPRMATATGAGVGSWTLSWMAPASGPVVDHYVIAARQTTENFYRTRVVVAANKTSQAVTAAELGFAAAAAFYVSVAAVDAGGHESQFAYPEYRCDATSCAVPAGSLDVTAQN